MGIEAEVLTARITDERDGDEVDGVPVYRVASWRKGLHTRISSRGQHHSSPPGCPGTVTSGPGWPGVPRFTEDTRH